MIAFVIVMAIALSNPAGLAYAASNNGSQPDNGAGGNLFDNIKVESSVLLGDTFHVDVVSGLDAFLSSPSGQDINISTNGDDIRADEVGFYKLSYSKKGNTTSPANRVENVNGGDGFYKEFSIHSYVKNELMLEVAGDGSSIPEYAASGTTITLPLATVVQYDDYGKRVEVLPLDADNTRFSTLTTTQGDIDHVYVEVFQGSAGDKVDLTSSGGTFTFTAGESNKNTSYFVRYSYVNSDTTPLLTKEFRIRTQIGFERDPQQKPVLSVNGPSNTADINTKVELPTASVTDEFQKNAQITISVTKDNNPVKEATVDPVTGWATGVADDAKVAYFDNGLNNFFYPTEAGDYIITYKAFVPNFDKDGKPTDAIASQQSRFVVRVLDRQAPIFTKMNDSMIPSSWGARVFGLDERIDPSTPNYKPTAKEVSDTTLKFPGFYNDELKVKDNVDTLGNGLKVEVKLTSPQNVDIWRYTDISDDSKSNEGKAPITGGTVFNKDAHFSDGFNFKAYQDAIRESSIAFDGEYTLTYRAYDSSNQSITKDYKIQITSSYTDLAIPVLSMPDNIETTLAFNKDLDWSIPNPTVSSTGDLRPTINYDLMVGSTPYKINFSQDGGTRSVVDRLKVVDEKLYLTPFTLDQQILDTVATGESREIATTGDTTKLTLVLSAVSSVGNHSVIDTTRPYNENSNFKLTTDITLANPTFDRDVTIVETNLNLNIPSDASAYAGVQGENVNLGGGVLVDGLSAVEKDFVGFEVTVTAPSNFDATDGKVIPGGIISNLSVDSWYESNSAGTTFNLNIDNIQFVPSGYGDGYMLTIRLFTVNGNNSVYTKFFSIDENQNSGGPNTRGFRSSINSRANFVVPDTTKQFESYRLPTWTEIDSNNNPTSHMRRRITGGAYEVMGDMFTPLTEGTFEFEHKWFTAYNQDWDNGEDLDGGKFATNANDSDSPVFSIVGDRAVAMYLATSSDTMYLLPTVTASNTHQSFDVDKPSIKDGVGNAVEAVWIDDVTAWNADSNNADSKVEADGLNGQNSGWAFFHSADGNYTVTFTAKQGNLSGTKDYNIAVGKVDAPAMFVRNRDASDTDSSKRTNNTTISRAYDSEFKFLVVRAAEITDDKESSQQNDKITELGYTFSKKLVDPDGTMVSEITDRFSEGNGVNLNKSGTWTVTYTITDRVGNQSKIVDTIIVDKQSDAGFFSLATISTILIILGIVLIVGAFVYLLLFRKVRVDHPTSQKHETTTTHQD